MGGPQAHGKLKTPSEGSPGSTSLIAFDTCDFSILGYSKTLRCSVPIDFIFVQIPSTHPCLLYRHPAVSAEIFIPTALRCAVTTLHDSRPVRYAGHSERVQVGVCKKISEYDVRDITGAGIAPVVSDLILRSRCFGEL